VRQYFGAEVKSAPCRAFEEMFVMVENGEVDLRVAAGGECRRRVGGWGLRAAVGARPAHQRRGHPARPPHADGRAGTKREEIKRVRSHPRRWRSASGTSTARANRRTVLRHRWRRARPAATTEPGVAVVASALAAELYGLEILERNVEDYRFNYTRFS
jgi:prephenate dehydratase